MLFYDCLGPMRSLYLVAILSCCFVFVQSSLAQNGVFTGLNGTTINVSCGANCNTVKVKVPHLKTPSDYTSVSIPYTPEAYLTPAGNELTSLYSDDRFSTWKPLELVASEALKVITPFDPTTAVV